MAINNTLTQQSQSAKPTISNYLNGEKMKAKINGILGSEREAQKFVSSIISAASVNPELQKCDNASIFSAALLANALGLSLSPSLGLAYMVPFKDRERGMVATFILGYRGYIQLAIRSGQYRHINVLAIKEGELISYNPLTEELNIQFIGDDDIREQLPTIGYYAGFELLNGFKKSIYWSKDKMIAHADKYSKAFKKDAVVSEDPRRARVSYADYISGKFPKGDEWKYSSFWYQNFDGMAFKTMIRQLISKWGIMSIDMQSAFEADGSSMEGIEAEAEPVVAVQSAEPGKEEEEAQGTVEEFDEASFFNE